LCSVRCPIRLGTYPQSTRLGRESGSQTLLGILLVLPPSRPLMPCHVYYAGTHALNRFVLLLPRQSSMGTKTLHGKTAPLFLLSGVKLSPPYFSSATVAKNSFNPTEVVRTVPRNPSTQSDILRTYRKCCNLCRRTAIYCCGCSASSLNLRFQMFFPCSRLPIVASDLTASFFTCTLSSRR
jgi:hypothetical protein